MIMGCLFDLSDHGKLELAGPDARSFLHNLCTQDVLNLNVGAMAEAFLTNAKARVIAHVWTTPTEKDVLWLDMVAGQAEKTLQHLNHYLISERVELTDRTEELALLRVAGPTPAGRTPTRRHRLLGGEGADFFCPIAEKDALSQQLYAGGVTPGTPEDYEIFRLEAGLPRFGIDIDENRLAMEVNRTAQAICYTKGCYLGQETIVMARDRGQVNRLLMGLKIADGPPLALGTKVFRGSEEVGQITSSVQSPSLGVIALAYLRRGNWDAGTELTADGRAALVCSLPFAS